MIPLHILAPSFNHKWILHNMGDELSGAYWSQCGPHNYTGVSNNIIKRNKNGTDFSKGYNRRVRRAFKKHGVTNFMFISSRLFYFIIEGFILEVFEELKNEGDKTIANLKFSFGQGGDTGPEARAKQSEAKSGEKNPQYGKSPSAETRAKQSEANSGEKHPQYGKTGENSHSFGKKASPETRAKISEANSGEKNPNYDDTVYNFQHKDGRKETCTQWELYTKHNLNRSHLSNVVNGKRKSTGGWRVVT